MEAEKVTMFNATPNSSHSTTKFGYVFLSLAVIMVICKFIIPIFMKGLDTAVLQGWQILAVILVGILLVYLNEDYFKQLFGLGKKAAEKKLGIDETPKQG